jgi:plastocyanin
VGRLRAHFAVAVVLVAVAAACGGDSASAPSGITDVSLVDMRGKAEGGNYPEVKVLARDDLFDPEGIQIDPGVTVEWTNDGRSPHNITLAPTSASPGDGFGAATGSFDPDDTYDFRFDKRGAYRYYCTLHGTPTKGMFGVVVVGDVPTSTEAGATSTSGGGEARTIHVPKDVPTIQEAVDRAPAGSLVLVAPGVYHEAVTVSTDDIVVRGESRSGTVLDGEFSTAPGHENGFKVLADGVAIENMTARNFAYNGFYWTGVKGFRGSYLTAVRNGDYGIYAFDSTNGVFDHSYASGSPDAGFYIGQCDPCHVVLSDDEAEWNGLGYSGTNAGGDLFIVRSSFHDNRAGIVPNSGTGEANPPQHDATIVGNTVFHNGNPGAPASGLAPIGTANGIVVAGGNDNLVARNLVYDHEISGIAVVTLPEKVLEPDNPNALNFDASGNRVVGNVVRNSGLADLVIVASLNSETDAMGNCMSGNTYTSSIPDQIEMVAPCDAPPVPTFKTDNGKFLGVIGAPKPEGPDYKDTQLPDPPQLPDMPDALTAPAEPATDLPAALDIDAIQVPSG